VAEVLKVDADSPEPDRIGRAAELIRRGEVVAIPTDTLYGLAADPFQTAAVERVFAVKRRAPEEPLLLLVDSAAMAERLAARLPASFRALAQRYWPGPLTIVVDASPEIPAVVTANTGRVGMRLPAAAIPRALAAAVGGAITGTSANRSGSPACGSAAEAESALGEDVPLILDGGASHSVVPSTVIGLRGDSWEMIREGVIRRAELKSFFRLL
jgi:L-threonylcarbamoyladenylate synthase